MSHKSMSPEAHCHPFRTSDRWYLIAVSLTDSDYIKLLECNLVVAIGTELGGYTVWYSTEKLSITYACRSNIKYFVDKLSAKHLK